MHCFYTDRIMHANFVDDNLLEISVKVSLIMHHKIVACNGILAMSGWHSVSNGTDLASPNMQSHIL